MPFTRGILIGRVDPIAHDRLMALLVVAASGRIARDPCEAIFSAMRCWSGGDRALAAIRLALVPLPRLASDGDAHTLFLAEAGLDAGLLPHALLAELGHAALVPLLKNAVDQPRVPAGSGRTSGRWTSGRWTSGGRFEISYNNREPAAADASPAVPTTVAPTQPATAGESRPPDAADSHFVPVFLAPERHGEDAAEDKPFPYQSRPLDDALQHGRLFDQLEPDGAPFPWPGPLPSSESRASAQTDDDEGPACPAMRNDRGGYTSPAGQEYEAQIAALVNPSSPTPKRTPQNPLIRSQAYYLPQPQMTTKESLSTPASGRASRRRSRTSGKVIWSRSRVRARPTSCVGRPRGATASSNGSSSCRMMPSREKEKGDGCSGASKGNRKPITFERSMEKGIERLSSGSAKRRVDSET